MADYERMGTGKNGSVLVDRCTDCGVLIGSREEHDRFHDILNDHARAIAMMETAHISERVHDRYDVRGRIKNRENV